MDTTGRDPAVVEVEKGTSGDCVEDAGIIPSGLVEGLGVGCYD